MKTIGLISVTILLFSCCETGRIRHAFEDNTVRCIYETRHGRIDGSYVSYYKNGNKKAQGSFVNNYRMGKWTVWDTTGRIRMQRLYSGPFTFKRAIPEVPDDKPILLLNVSPYRPEQNQDGFIEYFPVRERDIVWSERIWRLLPEDKNQPLFSNRLLDDLILSNIQLRNITPFTGYDFVEEHKTPAAFSGFSIVSYKIMEDWFFDNERLVSESRIVGICPVAVDNRMKDTVDLFWVSFPEIRAFMAQVSISDAGLPDHIKTLDDLFFYRCFSGYIFKDSNPDDIPVATPYSERNPCLASESKEIGLIEKEHDIWIGFTQ